MGGNETQIDTSQPAPSLLEACKVTVDLWVLNTLVVRDKLDAAIAAEEKRLATPPDHAARLREAAPRLWHIVARLAHLRGTRVRPNATSIIVTDDLLKEADEVYDELMKD